MKFDDDDQDAIYAKGYDDGRADVLKQLSISVWILINFGLNTPL